MQSKKQTNSKSPFRAANIKGFLFFLALSAVIWFLVQFSKTYQQSLNIPFELTEVPKNKILDVKKKTIDIQMNDNGFNLAWYNWTTSSLEIPVDSLIQLKKAFLLNQKIKSGFLQKQFGLSENEFTFLDGDIKIPFTEKATKKVPIIPHIEFNFSPGYGAKSDLVLNPDSLKITGNPDSLKNITAIDTRKLTFSNIKSDKKGSVKLEQHSKAIDYFKNEVDFHQSVGKFTEGRFQVPIELINVPDNWEVELFPKTAVVIFKATLEDYKNLSESDFRVVCNFQEGLESGRDFLIPHIEIYPNEIFNEHLNINRVDFIISK